MGTANPDGSYTHDPLHTSGTLMSEEGIEQVAAPRIKTRSQAHEQACNAIAEHVSARLAGLDQFDPEGAKERRSRVAETLRVWLNSILRDGNNANLGELYRVVDIMYRLVPATDREIDEAVRFGLANGPRADQFYHFTEGPALIQNEDGEWVPDPVMS